MNDAMKEKVVPLCSATDIGDDVSIKEVRFLQLVEPTLESRDNVSALPRSLSDRVRRLRDKAKLNMEAEAREM